MKLILKNKTLFSWNYFLVTNVFFQLVLISWMKTLSSCLIWQIISIILPSNEYGCVYAWTTLGSGPAIDLQKMPILAKKKKNHIFRWSPFWSWRVCKQAKLPHLGHRKSAPKSDVFWVRRLFNICVRVFCVLNPRILLVYIPAAASSEKMIFFFFCLNQHLL